MEYGLLAAYALVTLDAHFRWQLVSHELKDAGMHILGMLIYLRLVVLTQLVGKAAEREPPL